ncbi:Mrr restriction system protein [Bifidobacterium actinocoloniiforme DSM 22766]|uniref:Mrr restriction system protein n=1 Tax=Bifidobacterium actinocoloniiforme DSM 22766 TaxID=1437605 RepID=A0A086Z0R0_9BIFI|nr:restriction endonuclease [Bifidobacterium actinocoloniiforme]AKV55316.1 restriction endonuclease [Bifidobacterium actinocoloniiforme DSM 22766]KFI40110.1 Mrr restriction system protein [Bifidobacterium actinocoloniiforme DSM 22766]
MTGLPTWEQFIHPVLAVLSTGETLPVHELRHKVTTLCALSDSQKTAKLSSGQPVAENRITWAVSYLNRVDAIERPSRGQYRITEIGHTLLKQYPVAITEKDLRALAKPDDNWWVRKGATEIIEDTAVPKANRLSDCTALDPIEMIEEGVERINSDVAAELLSMIQSREPAFFEYVVMDLLIAMGYGGTHGKGTVTRLTNDGGIDGIIDQDALGLSKIYIQAKRYGSTNSVHRPEVQSFVGALSGKADGGLFITTSSFSSGAVQYAQEVPSRIILIDGKRLTQLMIAYGIGVETKETVKVVRIDEDYFA